MSLFSKQLSVVSGQKVFWLSVICCLFLSSCGFQPVYGTKSSVSDKSPLKLGVKISATAGGVLSTSGVTNPVVDDSATTSMERQFTNNLEDKIGSSANPEYKLDVALQQSSVGIGVARDGTASRYNLVINSNYKLIRISDGKEVDSGTINNVTSYNNPSNRYFSTYISEQDARKRGIEEIAEVYRQRLIAFEGKKFPTSQPLSTPPPIDENCPKNC